MANTTDVFWEIDGVSLQTYAWNITTWGGTREAPPAMRGSNLVIPYRPGQKFFSKTPDSRTITLSMWVQGSTEDGGIPTDGNQRAIFEKNWHALRSLLWQPRKQFVLKKRFRLYGDNTIYTAQALAEFGGGLSPEMTGGLRATFSVDLILADPFFYGDPITLKLDPEMPEADYTILGDDRTMDITAKITGLTKNLRVANETHDVSFDYNKALPAGQVATVDVKNFKARHNVNGTNDASSSAIEHEGDPFWFFLEPGVNRLAIGELDVPTRGTVWTNNATNPSFETSSGSTTIRTNLMQNPNMKLSDASAVGVYRTNYVVNPVFGTDVNNWTVQNAGVTKVRDTSNFYSGTASMAVTTAGTAADGVYTSPLPLNDWIGKPLAAAIIVKAPAGASMMASIHTGGGGTLRAVSFTGNGDWQRIDIPTATIPVNSTTGPYVYVRSLNVVPAFTFWVDSASMERASAIGDIFSGASTGGGKTYAWTGTAHASTSTASATLQTITSNTAINPGFENGAAASTLNQMVNPSMQAAAGWVNLVPNPKGANAADRANWLFSTDGSGGLFTGTYTATGGPTAQAPSFMTINTSGTPNTGYAGFGPGRIVVSQGNWYTGFVWARARYASGTVRLQATWYDGTGAFLSAQDVTAAQSLTNNVWTAHKGTFQAPTGAMYLALLAKFGGFTSSSQQVDATGFMLVPVIGAAAEYPYDYFDGSGTTMAEYSTAWAGASDLSVSILRQASLPTLTNQFFYGTSNATKGTKSVFRTNLVRNPRFGTGTTDWSFSANTGTAALTRVTTGGPTDYNMSDVPTFGRATYTAAGTTYGEFVMNATSNVPVTPGTAYNFSVYVRTSAALSGLILYVDWYNSSNSLLNTVGSSSTTSSTSWSRVGFNTGAAPAGAAYAVLHVRILNSIPNGFLFDVSAAMLEAGTFYSNPVSRQLNGYFDGASTLVGTNNTADPSLVANSGDYTLAWSGTANASASTMSANDVQGWIGVGAAVVQGHGLVMNQGASTTMEALTPYQWKGYQTGIFVTSQSGTAYATLLATDLLFNSFLTPGQTYTVLLRYQIENIDTTLSAPTGQQEALVYTDNVQGSVQSRSSIYAASGSDQGNPIVETRLTFTVAPTALSASIRFNIGRSQGARQYWIDDVLVVPGTYTGSYFDGDSPETATHAYVWNGAAYGSSSSRISKGTVGYTNVVPDPGFDSVDSSTGQVVYQNLFVNPNFKTANGTATYRVNAVTNPRVGTATTNYALGAGTGGTAALSRTTGPTPGPASITAYARATWSVAQTATTAQSYLQYGGTAAMLPAFPGDIWQAQWYCRDSMGSVKTPQLIFIDASGNGLQTINGAATPSNTGWNLVQVMGTAPAGTAGIILRTVCAGLRSVGATLDMTGAIAELAEYSTQAFRPYFDGATTGPDSEGFSYGWAGTADASSSTSRANGIESGVYTQTKRGVVGYQYTPDGTNYYFRQKAQNSGADSAQYTNFAVPDYGFVTHVEISVDVSYASTNLFVDNADRAVLQVSWTDSSGAHTVRSAKGAQDGSWSTLTVAADFTNATNINIRLYHGGRSGDNDLLWRNFTIINAKPPAGALKQFSGDTPNSGDVKYTWDSTANSSTTTVTYLSGKYQFGASNIVASLSSEWKASMGYSMRFYNPNPNFASGINRGVASLPVLQAGQSYLVRAKIYLPAVLTGTTADTGKFGVTTGFAQYTWTSAGFTNTVGVQSVSAIITTPQDIYNGNLVLNCAFDPGQVMYLDELEVIHLPNQAVATTDPSAIPQVIGYAASVNGYENRWIGAVGASNSITFAPFPYDVDTPNPGLEHQMLSADWGNPGNLSLRIRPLTASLNTYVDLDGGQGGLRHGMVAGATYQISARIRLPGAQTGTVNSFARTFQVYRMVGGTPTFTQSAQATNVAGETYLTATVTIEAGATDAWIRLWNGAGVGAGDVYWDQVSVIKLVNATDVWPFGYFDGGTAAPDQDFAVSWTGTPNVSTSKMAYTTPSGGSPSLGRITAVQSSQWSAGGAYSVRLIPRDNASNDSYYAPNGAAVALQSGLVAGNTYTFRVTRRLAAPLTGTVRANAGQLVVFWTVGGVTSSTATTTPLAVGQQDLSITLTIPSGATAAAVYLYHGGFSGSGDIYFDNLMVVQVPDTTQSYTGIYFDGDSAYDTDLFPKWSGAQYTSASQLRGVKLNKISRPEAIQSGAAGNPSLRVLPTSGQESYADLTSTVTGLSAGQTYLIRGTVTLPAIQQGTPNSHARRIVVFWSTGEITPSYQQLVPNAAGTYDYIGVYTMPSTGTLASIRAYNGDLYQGNSVWWDNILIGLNLDQTVTYFSGDTPSAGGDFQYSWAGTANDSNSIMSATGVATVVGASTAAAIYASSWASKGGHSLLLMPTTISNNSFAVVGGSAGALRMGMSGGGTYTIQAKVRLDAPQTGAQHGFARSIVLGYKSPTDGSYTYVASNQAPNQAGVWFCRLTVTLPATVNDAFVELYNGASLGNGNVWWDEFLLVQVDDAAHPYLGDYFDGNTPDTDYADYGWTGTPDASTSTIKGVAATAPVELTYRPAWL